MTFWAITFIPFVAREREKGENVKRVPVFVMIQKHTLQTLFKEEWARSVVMGWDSCTEGCGFESQHRIRDEHFFKIICWKKCYAYFLKRSKINEKEVWDSPFKNMVFKEGIDERSQTPFGGIFQQSFPGFETELLKINSVHKDNERRKRSNIKEKQTGSKTFSKNLVILFVS